MVPDIGDHIFNVRMMSSSGQWSSVYKQVVRVDGQDESFIPSKVVQAGEYFWGDDPGEGEGIAILASDGSFDSQLESFYVNPIYDLDTGFHRLAVRLFSNNSWSSPFYASVYLEPIFGCIYPEFAEYNPDANLFDNSCNTPAIFGCIDSIACNYDLNANTDNSSCFYPETYYDCDGECINDIDGDNVCDVFEISGCTDTMAVNYYDLATDDDGSCEILGCTLEFYPNFNPYANVEDGSCDIYSSMIYGCTDPFSSNYDSLAVIDYMCDPYDYQIIQLEQGWDIISSFIEPFNNQINSIFKDVRENLIIVKDNFGNVYWPSYGFNGISAWNNENGYYIKMEESSQLKVSGNILPENTLININQGWNIISYLLSYSKLATDVFNEYDNHIVLVKDSEGFLYIPDYNYNSIGNLSPGKGYKIRVNSSLQFNY